MKEEQKKKEEERKRIEEIDKMENDNIDSILRRYGIDEDYVPFDPVPP